MKVIFKPYQPSHVYKTHTNCGKGKEKRMWFAVAKQTLDAF